MRRCFGDDRDVLAGRVAQRLRLRISYAVNQLVLHQFVARAEGKFGTQIVAGDQAGCGEVSAAFLQSTDQLLVAWHHHKLCPKSQFLHE